MKNITCISRILSQIDLFQFDLYFSASTAGSSPSCDIHFLILALRVAFRHRTISCPDNSPSGVVPYQPKHILELQVTAGLKAMGGNQLTISASRSIKVL